MSLTKLNQWLFCRHRYHRSVCVDHTEDYALCYCYRCGQWQAVSGGNMRAGFPVYGVDDVSGDSYLILKGESIDE